MELRILILLITFQLFTGLRSQNLLLNGDFESCDCPDDEMFKSIDGCQDIKPLYGTTVDYYNSCSQGMYSTNNVQPGSKVPYSGDGYVGLVLKSAKKGYHEYLSLDLDKSLKVGMEYRLTFYLCFAKCGEIVVNKFTALVLNNIPKLSEGMIDLEEGLCFDLEMTDLGEWQKLEATYKAVGGEKYLIFGMTRTALEAVVELKNNSTGCYITIPYAYAYLDNVSLVPIDSLQDFTHY